MIDIAASVFLIAAAIAVVVIAVSLWRMSEEDR